MLASISGELDGQEIKKMVYVKTATWKEPVCYYGYIVVGRNYIST